MTSAELVDTIGLIAGGCWLAGALYWQLVSERHCPFKYSLGMFVIGTSLLFGSSAVVLKSVPDIAVVLAIAGNTLMLAMAAVVHVHLMASLGSDGGGPPDEGDGGTDPNSDSACAKRP